MITNLEELLEQKPHVVLRLILAGFFVHGILSSGSRATIDAIVKDAFLFADKLISQAIIEQP